MGAALLSLVEGGATANRFPALTNAAGTEMQTPAPVLSGESSLTQTSAPPTATPARPAVDCRYPAGWVAFMVRSGDTLRSLSFATGINLTELLEANCLKENATLLPGDTIYLPFAPYSTQVPPVLPWSAGTATQSPTQTPVLLPTATATAPIATSTQTLPIETPESIITPEPTEVSVLPNVFEPSQPPHQSAQIASVINQ